MTTTAFAFWSGAASEGVTPRVAPRAFPVTATPALPNLELSALVQRAAAGDRDCESVLVERMRPAIRAFCRRRLRGADADELVQDAVLLLIEALREGRVADPEALGSFTLGLCRNLVRDRARLAERRAALWERFGPAEEAAEPRGPLLFNRGLLEDCLGQLTQRTRAVLKQAYVEDAPNPDIARALALSEGNVRVIRHRALAQLRECLDKPLVWSTP